MTQPSVSQHIHALEDHFNTNLFYRSGRHLELSEAGVSLIPLAREAVRLSNHIDETISSLDGEIHGHLHVGCSTSIGKYILPHLLAQFHQRHPRVQVTCQVAPEKQSFQMLEDDEVHFIISSLPPQANPQLDSHIFIRDSINFITPLNHPMADQKTIEPDELFKAEFILREEGSGTYQAVKSALSKVEIPLRNLPILLTLGNSEAIAHAVREGIGVGFVSEMIVNILGQEKVACVEINGLEIFRDLYVSWKQNKKMSVVLGAFSDFLSDINAFDSIQRYSYFQPDLYQTENNR